MRIEKDFLKQAMEHVQGLENNIAQENASLTSDEQSARRARLYQESRRIMESQDRIYKNTIIVPDKEKIRKFCSLYERALAFAEYMKCYVLIESDLREYGRIILKYNYLLFNEYSPEKMLNTYQSMLLEAKSASTYIVDGVIESQYLYELADRTKQNNA